MPTRSQRRAATRKGVTNDTTTTTTTTTTMGLGNDEHQSSEMGDTPTRNTRSNNTGNTAESAGRPRRSSTRRGTSRLSSHTNNNDRSSSSSSSSSSNNSSSSNSNNNSSSHNNTPPASSGELEISEETDGPTAAATALTTMVSIKSSSSSSKSSITGVRTRRRQKMDRDEKHSERIPLLAAKRKENPDAASNKDDDDDEKREEENNNQGNDDDDDNNNNNNSKDETSTRGQGSVQVDTPGDGGDGNKLVDATETTENEKSDSPSGADLDRTELALPEGWETTNDDTDTDKPTSEATEPTLENSLEKQVSGHEDGDDKVSETEQKEVGAPDDDSLPKGDQATPTTQQLLESQEGSSNSNGHAVDSPELTDSKSSEQRHENEDTTSIRLDDKIEKSLDDNNNNTTVIIPLDEPNTISDPTESTGIQLSNDPNTQTKEEGSNHDNDIVRDPIDTTVDTSPAVDGMARKESPLDEERLRQDDASSHKTESSSSKLKGISREPANEDQLVMDETMIDRDRDSDHDKDSQLQVGTLDAPESSVIDEDNCHATTGDHESREIHVAIDQSHVQDEPLPEGEVDGEDFLAESTNNIQTNSSRQIHRPMGNVEIMATLSDPNGLVSMEVEQPNGAESVMRNAVGNDIGQSEYIANESTPDHDLSGEPSERKASCGEGCIDMVSEPSNKAMEAKPSKLDGRIEIYDEATGNSISGQEPATSTSNQPVYDDIMEAPEPTVNDNFIEAVKVDVSQSDWVQPHLEVAAEMCNQHSDEMTVETCHVTEVQQSKERNNAISTLDSVSNLAGTTRRDSMKISESVSDERVNSDEKVPLGKSEIASSDGSLPASIQATRETGSGMSPEIVLPSVSQDKVTVGATNLDVTSQTAGDVSHDSSLSLSAPTLHHDRLIQEGSTQTHAPLGLAESNSTIGNITGASQVTCMANPCLTGHEASDSGLNPALMDKPTEKESEVNSKVVNPDGSAAQEDCATNDYSGVDAVVNTSSRDASQCDVADSVNGVARYGKVAKAYEVISAPDSTDATEIVHMRDENCVSEYYAGGQPGTPKVVTSADDESSKSSKRQSDEHDSENDCWDAEPEEIQGTRRRLVSLNRIKVTLYSSGSRVHRSRGYEKMFQKYWNSVLLLIEGRSNHPQSTKMRQTIETFLKTRKLRKLHNLLIIGILQRCQEAAVPRRSLKLRDLPDVFKDKLKCMPRGRLENVSSDSGSRKRKRSSSICPTPYAPLIAGTAQASVHVVDPATTSATIPGALLVDPFLKKTTESLDMTMSENAVCLLVIAIKEYAKSILKSALDSSKALEACQVPPRPLLEARVLNKKKAPDFKDDKSMLSVKSDKTKMKCISAFDVYTVTSGMTIGSIGSLGGCVSRSSFEWSLSKAFDFSPLAEGEGFCSVKSFIANELSPPPQKVMKIDHETNLITTGSHEKNTPSSKQTSSMALNPPNKDRPANLPMTFKMKSDEAKGEETKNEQITTRESHGDRRSVVRGMGRGAKDLVALKARASFVSNNRSSGSVDINLRPNADTNTAEASDDPAKSSSSTKTDNFAPQNVNKSGKEELPANVTGVHDSNENKNVLTDHSAEGLLDGHGTNTVEAHGRKLDMTSSTDQTAIAINESVRSSSTSRLQSDSATVNDQTELGSEDPTNALHTSQPQQANDELSSSTDHTVQSGSQQRRGKGFGIKNLAAMLARNKPSTHEDSGQLPDESESSKTGIPTASLSKESDPPVALPDSMS